MKWNRQEWAEIIGSIGAAALIGGYIRYSVAAELLLSTKIILIAGGVLFAAGIVLGFGGIIKFFSRRSSQLGTNTTILTIAVIAILVVMNYLGSQHHKRFDLTSEKLYSLSDQTDKIVRGLKQDVNVVRFDKVPAPQLDDLMKEYKNLSPHFKYQSVDPQEKPEMASEYGAKRMGDVIVAYADKKEPIESSAGGDVSEQDITGALLKLTTSKQKTVCFVTGHGEKSLDDTGPHGYSMANDGMKKEQLKTESVNLVSSNEAPPECNILVVAGPLQAYFPQEVAMVSKYLDGGGKALIEVDPITEDRQVESGLDPVFQSWNINVGKNVVIDASGMGRLLGAGPQIPLVVDYGSSPITKNLSRATMTFFPLARTVSAGDKSKTDPEIIEILKTSPRSFTKAKIEHEVSYDPKTDTIGPLSLGVAANSVSRPNNSRLVVIGDSDFASNEAISQTSNGDLFLNAIDWLAQDENLISIRPKSIANRSVTLTEAQWAMLKWLGVIFLPGFIVLAGIIVWWKRR
jgi:ABC-type uncharacterized transport system involved in gliding motility auxiliary subunit